MGKTPKSVALKFVEVINAGDSGELIKLQTESFTLIDMAGDVFRGRDGWQDYFSSYPKYKIHVQHVLMSGNGVAIIGKTTGSHVPPEVGTVLLPNGGYIRILRKPRRKSKRR